MSATRTTALVAGTCCAIATTVGAMVAMDHLFVTLGRPDLVGLRGETWVLVAGIASAAVVGAALAVAQPRHPVGWLFLGLSGAITLSGAVDSYVNYGLRLRPGSLPGTRGMAVVGDKSFIPWLVLVALILFLTPNGEHLGRGWRLAARATVVAGVVAFLSGLLSSQPLSPPHEDVTSPWTVSSIRAPVDLLAGWSIAVVGLGLIVAGASLLVRFRKGSATERRQLMWLAVVVVPLPVFVLAAFVAARAERGSVAVIATAGFVVLVPVAAGLSASRYHLYDVERLLTATITYVSLTMALLLTYGFVVMVGASGGGSWSDSPTLAATVGALAAAAVAAPLRRLIQQRLDRRFNRRQYDARRVVADGLAAERADVDLQGLLARAFEDDSVTVAYPAAGDHGWLDAAGRPPAQTAAVVDVHRHDRLVARIGFDPDRIDAQAVVAASSLAAVELDNARLRAELGRQLGEVSASRRRLASAQRRERRRIERDLHDGAQQSLLALALNLQAARLSHDPGRMEGALAEGADAARAALRELRDLANGLHPAALADGGLPAALDDLSRHSSVPLRVVADVPRLDGSLEFTAWLVLAEAVVNAQKHAHATGVDVDVRLLDHRLHLTVHDDGRGSANPDGAGLRGLRDRVETARGTFTVRSAAGTGTTIEAVLPCES